MMKSRAILVFLLTLGCLGTVAAQTGFTVNTDGTVNSKSLAVTGNVTTTGTIAAAGDLSTAGALSVTQTIQAKAGFGYVPIGTILPWYNVSAAAVLPAGWYKCDGQTVAVAAGGEADLLDGVSNSLFATPNLNAVVQDGLAARGVFLRGGSTAGTVQGDAVQGHAHGEQSNSGQYAANNGGGPTARTDTGSGSFNFGTTTGVTTDPTYGAARVASETRPLNMSVIWIIRVK